MIDFSKMEGHTPGPWFIEGITKRPDETIVWVSSGKTSAPMPVGSFYPILGDVMANSSLIAAAPAMKNEILRQRAVIDELVEALTWALAEIDGTTNYDRIQQRACCLAKAEAAIKKAKGE